MLNDFRNLYHDDEVDKYFKYTHDKFPVPELINDKDYMNSDVAKGYITYKNNKNINVDVFFDIPLRVLELSKVKIHKDDISRDKAILVFQSIDHVDESGGGRHVAGENFTSLFWKYQDSTKKKAIYLVLNDYNKFSLGPRQEDEKPKKNTPSGLFRGELFFLGVVVADVVDNLSEANIKGDKIVQLGNPDKDKEIKEEIIKKEKVFGTKPYAGVKSNYSVNIRGMLESELNIAIYERHNGWFFGNDSFHTYNEETKMYEFKSSASYYNIVSYINSKTKNGMVMQKKYSSKGIEERVGKITNNIVKWNDWKLPMQDYFNLKSILEKNPNYLKRLPYSIEEWKDMQKEDEELKKIGLSDYIASGSMKNEYIPKYGFKFKNKNGVTIYRKGIHTLDKEFIKKAVDYIDTETDDFKLEVKKYPIYDDYVYDKENRKLADHIKKNAYPENYMFRYLGQVEYRDRDGELLSDMDIDRLFSMTNFYTQNYYEYPYLWRWLNNSLGREFIITSKRNPIINGYFVKKPGVRIDIPGSKKERLGILKVYTYPQRAFEYKHTLFNKHKDGRYTKSIPVPGADMSKPPITKSSSFNEKMYPYSFDPAYKDTNPQDIPNEFREYLNGERISRMYIYQEIPVNKDYFIRGSKKIKGKLGKITEKQLNDELEDTLHYTQYIHNIFDFDKEYTDLTIGPVNRLMFSGAEEKRQADDDINAMTKPVLLPLYENPRDPKYSLYPYHRSSYLLNDFPINMKEGSADVAYIPKPPIKYRVSRVERLGWINHRLFIARDRLYPEIDPNPNIFTTATEEKSVLLKTNVIPKPDYEGL